MIEMARDEQKYRHMYDFKDQQHKMWFERRAQFCTLATYIFLFGMGGVGVILGHGWFGGTLVGAAFITAIGSSFFNSGREESSKPEEEPPRSNPPPIRSG